MSEVLKGRAKRTAAALLAESGIVGANDAEYDGIVSALALAWLDGYTAGTGDSLAVVGGVELDDVNWVKELA